MEGHVVAAVEIHSVYLPRVTRDFLFSYLLSSPEKVALQSCVISIYIVH